MLVGCDHRESFTGSEEPPGIVPVGMYGVGGNHRDREYHGGRIGCDRWRIRGGVLDVGVGISRDGEAYGETVLGIRYREKAGTAVGWRDR